MSDPVKARLLAAARAIRSPSRSYVRGQSHAITLVALAVSIGIFLVVGAARPSGRPPSLIFGTTVGAALIATAFLFVLLRGGSRMLGPARSWLLVPALLAPIVFLIWKLGFTSQFPGMLDPWPARPGLRCFLLTFVLAMTPLLAILFIRRDSDPIHPGLQGFAWGIATGMGATVLADLWCPVAYVPHLLGGHITPVLILGLLAYLAGTAWLSLRPYRRDRDLTRAMAATDDNVIPPPSA